MGASTMLSKVNILVNVGYGEELEGETRNTICEAGSMIKKHGQSPIHVVVTPIQEECINQSNCDFVNEEMGILNRKGGRFLNKLYGNNEEFRE